VLLPPLFSPVPLRCLQNLLSVQVLEELFSFLTSGSGGAPAALAGLMDAQAATEERPRAAVVVASAADATSAAVAAQLEGLTAAAGSHVRLPNAVHEVRARELRALLSTLCCRPLNKSRNKRSAGSLRVD
jgi:lipase chaperone LimK